jgi:ankyrin repeat protein
MLNCGLQFDCCYYNPSAPLLTAEQVGHSEVDELLKESGADMRASDEDGNNVIYCAAWSGNPELVNYQLDSVLNIDCCNKTEYGYQYAYSAACY